MDNLTDRRASDLASLAAAAHEACVGMAATGEIVLWNTEAERLLGWHRDEVLGRPLAEIMIPERLRAAHASGMAHYHASGNGPYLDRLMSVPTLTRNGHEIELEMTLTALPGGGACAFFAYLREPRQTADESAALAMRDALTGLPNRRAFLNHLEEAMARARRSGRTMALFFMDIDHFKSVNDTLGHAAGDALIQGFASRMLHSVREVDCVARLGGDEFTVILEGLGGPADAEIVAAKLVSAMSERFDLGTQGVRVSTSIGIALYDGDQTTGEALLARADSGLYASKHAGRNTWRFADPPQLQPARATGAPTVADFIGCSPGESLRRHFLDDLLGAIRGHLGLEVAFISEFTNGQRLFRHVAALPEAAGLLHVDDGGPLDESYCQRVVDGRLPELITDACTLPAALELPVTTALPVGAHLSVPIRLSDGRVYGTFCVFSRKPDHSMNARDLDLMRAFADLAARHLERHT